MRKPKIGDRTRSLSVFDDDGWVHEIKESLIAVVIVVGGAVVLYWALRLAGKI